MKLLTHNMLSSKGIKGVNVGFPLLIDAKEVKKREVEFNGEFVARIIPKLDWNAVLEAAKSINEVRMTRFFKEMNDDLIFLSRVLAAH